MKIIRLESVDSTSSYLQSVAAECDHGTVVIAREQTAGRGQRGNHWESEPGKNLTFSLMLRPIDILASEQFAISEAVALGIATTLEQHLGQPVEVKWPNDIYVGDSKICGILIENAISGRGITRSIAGIGINVNQAEFRSDAPNPVSMRQLSGHEFDLDTMLSETVSAILANLELPHDTLHTLYQSRLYRRNGPHPYRDCLRGTDMMAEIVNVAPDGMLTLRDQEGTERVYAFKEVSFK